MVEPGAGRYTLKFLGTGGARVVVTRQVRATGGIWLSLGDTCLLLDPGPGSLVRCLASRPRLDPRLLDAVILSHKHIDHSNDVNILCEAMTEGGLKRRGRLFCPSDCLDPDPVVFSYVRTYVAEVVVLAEGGAYRIGEVTFQTPTRNVHPVETYSFLFDLPCGRVAFITDTAFYPELATAYRADLLVLNVLRDRPGGPGASPHLDAETAREVIARVRPKAAVLTHFGMGMIRAKPWVVAEAVARATGVPVLAARDGQTLDVAALCRGEAAAGEADR